MRHFDRLAPWALTLCLAFTKGVDGAHLVAGQFEAEEVEVLAHAVEVRALRQDRAAEHAFTPSDAAATISAPSKAAWTLKELCFVVWIAGMAFALKDDLLAVWGETDH